MGQRWRGRRGNRNLLRGRHGFSLKFLVWRIFQLQKSAINSTSFLLQRLNYPDQLLPWFKVHHRGEVKVETDGGSHIMFKGGGKTDACVPSPLLQFRTPCLGHGVTHSGLGLSVSIKLMKTNPHRHVRRLAQCTQPLMETLSWQF